MVARLLARARQLTTAPLSGRQVPDYPRQGLRELLERPYRIIYRITTERIEILTVMHYRQLLPRKASALQNSGQETP
ncbi:MAG: type II toxin-antitoxin system RelE/ParE family toxin [Pseudomonadota bacterium]